MNKNINEFIEWMNTKNYATTTIKTYSTVLNSIFKDTDIKNYEYSVETYFANTAYVQASTTKSRIHYLSGFQTWLLKSGKISEDRLIDFSFDYSPRKVKKKAIKYITDDELELIFKTVDNSLEDKLALTIFLETGVRDSEFADYFNNLKKLVKLDSIIVSGKSIEDRYIPVTDNIKRIATELYDKRSKLGKVEKTFWPESYAGRDRRLKAIAKHCDLTLNLHMFRATFATNWSYRGHDIIDLQQAMGHSSLSQLDHYISKNPKRMMLTWKKYANGEDFNDRNFLLEKIKLLEIENSRLESLNKKLLKETK